MDIKEEMKQKPIPPSIEIKEMMKAKKSLKIGKSTGTDFIPNETIIKAIVRTIPTILKISVSTNINIRKQDWWFRLFIP